MPVKPGTHKPHKVTTKVHKPTQAPEWGGGRGGRPWRRKRQQALERDGFLCVPCSKLGIVTVATEVDHIRNVAIGGTDDEENLQSICTTCHRAKTASESNATRRKGEGSI